MFKSKRTAITAAASAVLLLLVCLTSQVATSGFNASVNNSANTIGSGTSFLTASKAGANQCSSVPTNTIVSSASTFPCSDDIFPSTVAATGNSTSAEVLTATGTSSFTSATYAVGGCAPVKFDNQTLSSDPLLVRGGVTFRQAGPTKLAGSGSTLFNGTDSSGTGVVQGTAPTNFSVGVWFKTASASGALMGWSSSSSNVNGGTYDRHLYFTSAGKLAFSTYSGGSRTVTSPLSYNDNNWHYAVVTAQSNVTTTSSRISLYVDGNSVVSTTFPVAAVGENTTGYWHLGHARSTVADGYTGTGQYFNGNLSNFTIHSNILTAANVTTLYSATSQTDFASKLTSVGVQEFWPVNDTGLTTYVGTYPTIGATSPCAHIRATVGTASKCLYPVLATACPAAGSTNTLAGLGAAPATALTPSTPGNPQTVTTTLSRDGAYNTAFEVGLHLFAPVTITENGFTQTFVWGTNETVI